MSDKTRSKILQLVSFTKMKKNILGKREVVDGCTSHTVKSKGPRTFTIFNDLIGRPSTRINEFVLHLFIDDFSIDRFRQILTRLTN